MSEQHENLVARVDETVSAIRAKTKAVPKVGVVLGSGLGSFADALTNLEKIPYAEIPNIPPPSIVGHAGNLCFGNVENVPVVCMQGRVHLYEGHPVWQVVHGVRVMAKLGAKCVLLTNAAGGIADGWAPGDLMVITDHINMQYPHPLLGPNVEGFGTRFPDMTNAYDKDLRAKLAVVAEKEKIELREGVYAGWMGPAYETPAEIRMLRTLGAQAVGMSTVPEVIALRHMRVPCAALSCITNLAAGISKVELNHAEVEETARMRREDLKRLLRGWILAAAE